MKNNPYLKKGDKIGLVCPAGYISKDDLSKAVANIEDIDLQPEYLPEITSRSGFWAGSAERRADELHYFFDSQDIKAIMAVRGGYGSFGTLELLDYELIKNNPKPFIGYSDISILLNVLYAKTGIPVFHAPMALGGFSNFAYDYFNKVFFQKKTKICLKANPKTAYVINSGTAEGVLVGGNLTVLNSLLGTSYAPDYTNKILFLEDVNEAPYKIHRMLTQMKAAGSFSKIKGIVLGIFSYNENYSENNKSENFTNQKVFSLVFNDLAVPVVCGFPFGHIKDNATIPVGNKARLNTNSKELTFSNLSNSYA